MEDGDTEKYHVSSVIQDFVFRVAKRVVSDVFHGRYIINVHLFTTLTAIFTICISPCDIGTTHKP